MIIISRKKLAIATFFFAFVILSVIVISDKGFPVLSKELKKTVVIDAGHGGADGGAVGNGGTIESDLNLIIAKKTKAKLKKMGINVILTRKNKNAVSNSGKTIAERKRSDMYTRLRVINSSNADLFVSIHMNKFPQSKYCGAQVLYSDNKDSELIAKLVQKKLCDIPENKSKRSALKTPGRIFLLNNANIPAIITECGFLSNDYDEKMLKTEEYQEKLATAISEGIKSYYKIKEDKAQ